METYLALRAVVGSVPITLACDIKQTDPSYFGEVTNLDLDVDAFLSELLSALGAKPLSFNIRRVRLDKLQVAYSRKSGWLGLNLKAEGFELFLIRQMNDKVKLAVGLHSTKPILLRELPYLGQYVAGFSDQALGIQDLGFLYAMDPGTFPFPCTGEAADGQGFEVFKGGFYAWITQNIIQPNQPLWVPPLKQGSSSAGDQQKTEQLGGGDHSKPAQPVADQSDNPPPSPSDADTVSSNGDSKIRWLNINKALGPLTLARIGGNYADGKVTIIMDASVSVAGLTLRLYGLGLRSPIYPITPVPTLSGMGISYARGPVELSGGLVTSDLGKSFFGEVLVKTKGFSLSAFGAYYDNETYKSLFVFGTLDYPLGGPPAFFVTGLAAGFGYHSKLILPEVAKLSDFVLVKGALPAASGKPLAINSSTDMLQTLTSIDSIQPDPGESWIAAGVRFTSFEMIQSFALITVSFGTRCEIALLGRSQMSIPPQLPSIASAPYALAFAEVDLKAVIDLDAIIEPDTTSIVPVLAVNGIVAAGSYVFAKGCRITGGFAFYVWSSGEFVVTFGGYHPRFSPPTHYPAVGRLGFVWPISGNLNAQGELYFALTGSTIMAGFAMQAVYQSGPVVASFFARADFLLSWKPFHYQSTISIQIRIALHLQLGLLTTNLSFLVGVALELHGPPFGGVAHVNLDIISFTIPFGSETPDAEVPLEWDEFARSFLPADSKAPAGTGARTPLVQWAGVTRGLIRESKEYGWIINPRDFEITTHTGVPATAATHTCANIDATLLDEKMNTKIGIPSMKIKQIASVHTITLNKCDDPGWQPMPSKCPLDFVAVLGNAPKALYGDDPAPSEDARLSTPSMIENTLTGIRIMPARQDPAKTQPMPLDDPKFFESVTIPYQGFGSAVSDSLPGTVSLSGTPDQSLKPTDDVYSALIDANLVSTSRK